MRIFIKRNSIIVMLLMIMNIFVCTAHGDSRERFSAYAEVNASRLNVRNIPTVNGSEVIGQLDDNTAVNVIERYRENNNASEWWYYVKASNGIEGWVSGKYLEISDSSTPTQLQKNTQTV